MSGDEFTTRIEFRPGYDHREESHAKGRRSGSLVLVLAGPLAVLTTEIITDWMPAPLVSPYLNVKHTPPPWQRSKDPGPDAGRGRPMAAATSMHARNKIQDWWSDAKGCPYLDGADCYGDVGYLVSDPVFQALVGEGHEAAFDRMRSIYDSWIAPEVTS